MSRVTIVAASAMRCQYITLQKASWVRTFECLCSFALGSLLSNTTKHRLQELSDMRLNLLVCIARHEDVRIRGEAFSAALGRAALQIGNLLDAHAELRLPLLLRYMHIFAVEDLVDRVGAVSGNVSALFALRVMMSLCEPRCGEATKSCGNSQDSPPGGVVAEIAVVVAVV